MDLYIEVHKARGFARFDVYLGQAHLCMFARACVCMTMYACNVVEPRLG